MGGRTIAILGGGQLGRMFIENALRYDVRIEVLDPDPEAPCARLAHRFVAGDLQDRDTVIRFAREADVVGIEIEHVSVEALEELKAMGKTVIPDPAVLRTIQDKGLQKSFYRDHNIPTSPFSLVGSPEELNDHDRLFPAFLKARRGGYDGRGVTAARDRDSVPDDWQWPSVLESMVDVDRELAVLVVRDRAGRQVVYDPVEMVFDPKVSPVDRLRAPARISDQQAKAAPEMAQKVAAAYGEPGIYAVEMLLSRSGEILVNETAPRAHNSGHHTIEACASSQFDQLLRLYMEWPLGDPTLRTPAAMINLVGAEGTGSPRIEGMKEILDHPGTFIHLYGKRQTRTGRKMGHVTVTANDQQQLDEAIAITRGNCRVVPMTSDPIKG